MKLFHREMTSFELIKVGIGRVVGVGIIVAGILITSEILKTEKEMTTLRRNQIQLERLQNIFSAFSKPQRLVTLPSQELRGLSNAFREYKATNGINNSKVRQSTINAYHEYMAGRGEMKNFTTMLENISNNISKMEESMNIIAPTLRGADAVITFSRVKKSFNSIQELLSRMEKMQIGHTQYVFLTDILTMTKDVFASLTNPKSNALAKVVRDYNVTMVSPIEQLIDDLNALQNKNSFIASQIPIVFAISDQISSIQESLTDITGIQNAYLRLGHEHITHFAMMMVLILFGVSALAIGRVFARGKSLSNEHVPVVSPEIVAKTTLNLESLQTTTLSVFLSDNMTTATAVTDTDENITWASRSFYQTLGLNPTKSYNWNKLLESHIVRANSALGIDGAVSILGRPGQELKLSSKTAQHGAENRILEFIPIYNYQAEMQKTMARLAPFTNIPGVDIYEASETISDVSTEISYLFQTTDTLFKVEDDRPIYIAFDKVLMRKSLKGLMTGLVIYLAHSKARRLVASYQKVGDAFSLTFTIPDHRFKEVSSPLVFRDKTYPSLSAYLEQIEISFQKYNARIVMKNIQKDGVDEAVIQLDLIESNDALFNLKTLEKKRRINRAVKTAEKVNQKSGTRKQNPTLGPKDFQ